MMMAYIGGVGTIVGPIIGAIFFVILRELLTLYLPEGHLIVFGTLFILVVLFLPGGFVAVWNKLQKRLGRGAAKKQTRLAPKPGN
jgi:branched-chain amino acid transport system permease protein